MVGIKFLLDEMRYQKKAKLSNRKIKFHFFIPGCGLKEFIFTVSDMVFSSLVLNLSAQVHLSLFLFRFFAFELGWQLDWIHPLEEPETRV